MKKNFDSVPLMNLRISLPMELPLRVLLLADTGPMARRLRCLPFRWDREGEIIIQYPSEGSQSLTGSTHLSLIMFSGKISIF
ncbi:MAG: hypothetical protein TH68_02250 [Candidatus Synechococcus spongiarum 142]|uniref:Uncharacterized protein n=1 Tax=Candidatus Synechococcus spongiarum 142 TaxID=1608213 RepID=A0A6N3XC10_9SYNE|nr:MAG: hypothetical protein TH68_02250 [Candidatus Synechococcus spongiarum 142]